MVEGGGGAASFPVVFFDGDREIDIGNIKIHPKFDYKTFQSMLAQRIGISPNQISSYLIDATKSNNFNGYPRKIPITGKANFAQISRERGWCVLVVLKRSRKTRGRKGFRGDYVFEDETTSFDPFSGQDVVLLRRNQAVPVDLSQIDCPVYDQNLQAELSQRLQNVVIHEGNKHPFLKNPYSLLNTGNNNNNNNIRSNCGEFPKREEAYPRTEMNKPKYFCKECSIAKKEEGEVEFHPCVNDVVFKGVARGEFGPIGRPIRR